MLRRLLLVVALLPAAAFAAGSFTLSSAEIKPGATIAEAQVFKGSAARAATFRRRWHGRMRPRARKASR
jgi:hypothetical protein